MSRMKNTSTGARRPRVSMPSTDQLRSSRLTNSAQWWRRNAVSDGSATSGAHRSRMKRDQKRELEIVVGGMAKKSLGCRCQLSATRCRQDVLQLRESRRWN